MGKASRRKQVARKQREQREHLDSLEKFAHGEITTDDYLADLSVKKDAESAFKRKQAAKLLAEFEVDDASGLDKFLVEMREMKKFVDMAYAVSIEDLDKMRAEFSVLSPKVAKKDGADWAKDLPDVVTEATQVECDRCDHIAKIVHERTHHTVYNAMHAQAKARRVAAFAGKLSLGGEFATIDNITASGGMVHIKGKDGELTTLSVREAAARALGIQEMAAVAPEWHRNQWNKLIERIVDMCREAKSQQLDGNDKRANLYRAVIHGKDAMGVATKVNIDERMVHNSKKLFPLLTEDEIFVILKDESMNMSMQDKDRYMHELHKQRAVDRGLDAAALQDMNLE